MTTSTPIICGSITEKASDVGVKMHNAAYAACGLNYTYLALSSDNFSEAFSAFKALSFKELAVSNPFKTECIKVLNKCDKYVKLTNACNTIINNNGKFVGYNTDCGGFINALTEQVDLEQIKRAVIVGAGGVARAIAVALKQHKIKVFLSVRNLERGMKVYKELKLDGIGLLNEQGNFGAELVINATPVSDEHCPVDFSAHKNIKAFFDVCFREKEPLTIKKAKALKIKAVPGWRMLLLQGAKQFELYTGLPAPLQAMESALLKALFKK